MGDFLKWLRDTEIYKDDKLWALFLVVLPTIAGFIGWIGNLIYKFFTNKNVDRENKKLIKELEAKYEERLEEKDKTIVKLIETNARYKAQLDIYKSSYGKLKARR